MIELLSIALKHSSIILNSIFIGAFILNLLFAFTIIFMERRSANSIWAWLLVLLSSAFIRLHFILTIRTTNST
ncbi:hypothetical protein ACVNP1_06460 [Staphylococcus aureus]